MGVDRSFKLRLTSFKQIEIRILIQRYFELANGTLEMVGSLEMASS